MNIRELNKKLSHIKDEIISKIPKHHLQNSLKNLPLAFLIKFTHNYKQDYVIFDSKENSYSYNICCKFNIGNFEASKQAQFPALPQNILTHLHLEKLNVINKNFIAIINIDKLDIVQSMKVIKDFNQIKGKFTLIIMGSNLENYKLFRNESKHTFFSRCEEKQLPKLYNVLLKAKYHKGKSLLFMQISKPIEVNYHPYVSRVQKWISSKIIFNKINIIQKNVNKISLGDFDSCKRIIIFSTEEEHNNSISYKGNIIEFVFSNNHIPQIPHKFNGFYHYPASEQELKLLAKKTNHLVGYHCIVVPFKLWEDFKIEIYNDWRYIKKTNNDAILTCGGMINAVSHWKKTIISCTNTTSINKDILKSLQNKIIVIDPTFSGTLINTLATMNLNKDIIFIHVPGKNIKEIREKFELSEKEIEKRSFNVQS